ncbi:MAG: NAD(P)/FAD-dependent oxidoreductase [Planctomycetota bacterium]
MVYRSMGKNLGLPTQSRSTAGLGRIQTVLVTMPVNLPSRFVSHFLLGLPINLSLNDRPHVVIVGGGFAGLEVAKRLGRTPHCDVTVIDRSNHHLFQPLLYQVAMAGLDPSDIACPIRSILAKYDHVRTIMSEVDQIDVESQRIHIRDRDLSYDYLVLACGAGVSYFGNDQWEDHAPGLKSIAQATEIRRRVLSAFEKAEQEPDESERKRQMTFVVVGGGPTGVELAGAIAEMANKTLRSDFNSIDPASSNVILMEGAGRLLASFDPSLSDYAARALREMGVNIHLNQLVDEISADGVQINDQFIPAATVIWAAGVAASPLGKQLGGQCDRSGRVMVRPDLSLPDHPNVFVIGDMAAARDQKGNQLPGVAPVAIQQGKYVGRSIANRLAKKNDPPAKPFRYFDKGQMATIGRRRAVLQVGKIKLTGTIAWLGWLFVHILFLNGMRNRVFVFLSWVWSYFLYLRGARLIVSSRWRSKAETPQSESVMV